MELFIWLRKNRISARKFAKRLGITESSLSNISREKVCPSLLIALKIVSETNGEIGPEMLLNAKARQEWENYLMKKDAESKK